MMGDVLIHTDVAQAFEQREKQRTGGRPSKIIHFNPYGKKVQKGSRP